ncbi:MAG: 2-dehydropantoate 2-reductase N-terminal domain-containing protein, partial [Chloroflexota bacterium]
MGCDVTLYGRPSWVDAINNDGLHLEWPDGRRHTVHPQAITDLATLDDRSDFDVVLVTPKSFATSDVVSGLAEKVTPKTRILSLQNGVGNEDRLAQALPNQPILAGSITLPVKIPQAGTIIVSKDKGGIGLASFTPGSAVTDIADRLQEAGFTVVTYDDYRSLKWSKLLMNIVANASSAILDMAPGESLAYQAIFDLEIAAMCETLAVMKVQ